MMKKVDPGSIYVMNLFQKKKQKKEKGGKEGGI